MTEISNSQKLNAYYSDTTKVSRPENFVAEAPNSIPTRKIYNDREAGKKMQAICNDIYEGAKNEQKKEGNNFIKYCGIGIAGLLGILGIKRLFK